jgi:hypothetical protein
MQRARQVCAEQESTVQYDKQNNRIVLDVLLVGGDLPIAATFHFTTMAERTS